MKKDYSIWLVPVHDDCVMLEEIIQHYVTLFGGHIFTPHMTLFSDLHMENEDIIPFCRSLAVNQASFSCSVTGIYQEASFFRSFYCGIELTQLLITMKQKAKSFFSMDDNKVFNPHISLGYGIEDSLQKQQEMHKQTQFFAGKTIKFDRVALVSSSDATPIQDWQITHSFTFL